MQISIVSKFHPLLVHFPIALVLVAAAAELMVIATARQAWRAVAVVNIRVGAAIGVVTAVTGWWLASGAGTDASMSLEWHRWLGIAGAAGAMGAALLSSYLQPGARRPVFGYRVTLFLTAVLIGITGHLGGTLVWGASFFQP
jgi:uncharacterized membrane protein